MARRQKAGKRVGNRRNTLKNLKRMQQNSEVLKKISKDEV
jgi:hypothetical protein